jgi:hypothetical protein
MAAKPAASAEKTAVSTGAFHFNDDHFIAHLPCQWIAKTAGHGHNVVWVGLMLFWRFCSMGHYGQLRISHRQLAVDGIRPEAVGPAMRTLIELGMVRELRKGSGRSPSLYELEFGNLHNEKFKGLRSDLLKRKEGKKRKREDDAAEGDAEPRDESRGDSDWGDE